MVRQRDAADSPVVQARCPLLIEALTLIGHIQTRNRGTIGGSLSHLDPSAEIPAVFSALDAVLHVTSARGDRDVPIADWSLGFMMPNLEPDELLVGITVPCWPVGHGYAFLEMARRHGDFALAGAGALMTLQDDGSIERVSVALTGVDTGPVRLTEAEAALVGRMPGETLFADGRQSRGVGRRYRRCPCTARLPAQTGGRLRAARPRTGASARPGRESVVMGEKREIQLTVNGQPVTREVEVRWTLVDFLRHELELTGTHVGCEHGVCGACTVLIDGRSARSCLTLAVQADGHEITTIEGLSPAEGLSPLQQAFADNHGLQCGYCTPGVLCTLTEFLETASDPSEAEIRIALSGNLCRCTGYQGMVDAVLAYVEARRTGTA